MGRLWGYTEEERRWKSDSRYVTDAVEDTKDQMKNGRFVGMEIVMAAAGLCAFGAYLWWRREMGLDNPYMSPREAIDSVLPLLFWIKKS